MKRSIKKKTFLWIGFCLVFSHLGCTSKSSQEAVQTEEGSKTNSQQVLVNRGKTIYRTQCIACHNSNPRKPGSIGPDVYGSSKELLEARIMKAEYPAGYQPKRTSHSMAPLPHLKGEIDALHAYLNSNESE